MYAQILKADMRVNLIGGTEEGLPLENHPLAFCVDISNRADVELYMKYNEETGEFYKESITPIPISPAQQREELYKTMTLKEDGTPLIGWSDKALTVDDANKVWVEYSAEGSEKANKIQLLVNNAKEYIRDLCPDAN